MKIRPVRAEMFHLYGRTDMTKITSPFVILRKCLINNAVAIHVTYLEAVGRVYSDWLRAGWSGNESWWGRDYPPVQTRPRAQPASCTMGTGTFPGVKCSRGVLLTTHPFLVPRSWKSRAIPLPTLWATPGL